MPMSHYRLASPLPLLMGQLIGRAREDQQLAVNELERERRQIRRSFKPDDPMMQAHLTALRLEQETPDGWKPVEA